MLESCEPAGAMNAILSPLWMEAQSSFGERCSQLAGHYYSLARGWMSEYGERPSPDGDDDERTQAVHFACSRALHVLSQPQWQAVELIRLQRDFPLALENPEFAELVAPHRTAIEATLEQDHQRRQLNSQSR
jgi:hypothetical protein